jgi:hypothetical protein
MIKFGENIYSYEFEELQVILYEITGNDFSFTEAFESTYNADNNQ